jgi:hypothetical protein
MTSSKNKREILLATDDAAHGISNFRFNVRCTCVRCTYMDCIFKSRFHASFCRLIMKLNVRMANIKRKALDASTHQFLASILGCATIKPNLRVALQKSTAFQPMAQI